MEFRRALFKLKKDTWAVVCTSFILAIGLMAVFAYFIAPDASRNANQMHLSIHSQPPGFSTQMLTLPQRQEESLGILERRFLGDPNIKEEIPILEFQISDTEILYRRFGKEAGYFEKFKLPDGFIGWEAKQISEALIAKRIFLLGTDKYGRDLLSRLLIGSRISIGIGFVAVFISLVIGIFFGAIAGYFGGRYDQFIMWLVNVVWSIPTLFMVIAITLALGRGFWQVFVAVGLTMWVEVARVVRGQVMSVKQQVFVQAAHALGFSHFRILIKHILPLLIAPLIVISAANFASAILMESGLSFLGIGAQPPMPSWGGMVKDHFRYLLLGKAYLAILPGIAIMSLVLCFMTLGNRLRDAFDVRA